MHGEYRTWQINQPFVNNNDPDKIDLSEHQVKRLINDKDIGELYPEIYSNE